MMVFVHSARAGTDRRAAAAKESREPADGLLQMVDSVTRLEAIATIGAPGINIGNGTKRSNR